MVYSRDPNASPAGALEVLQADSTTRSLDGGTLDKAMSRDVFGRTGRVRQINATMTPN
ncbi:MAG: hypothetical protein AAGI54_07120 [Planctomycetota bacterium]